ncbi:hypothetical protein [Candidatus Poriferisodalis sp.]|uniref:hypothetical protein n=1 Tax=Candidatus Poriferisodalis sp. TaxID=3101277 RepID=UPI003B0254EB
MIARGEMSVMSPESEIDRWNRWSGYSRADLEKVQRSTAERRRRLRVWSWSGAVLIYLTPFGFAFAGPESESFSSRLVDAAIPDPFAWIVLIFILGGAGAARRSSLTDDEARALGDEAEEQAREDREFARWLWTGRGRGPGQK